MPFDYDDPYEKVGCKVLGVRPKAVQIEDEHGAIVWVPRSCLHGADDRLLDDSVGVDMDLRIRRWFAEKEGLI